MQAMRFSVNARRALLAAALAVAQGCGRPEAPNPLTPQVTQLARDNRELRGQVNAQDRIIYTMGGALLLAGGGMAVVLAVVWLKGRK